MTRNKLEKCLEQHVSIIFFDGTIVKGTLCKSGSSIKRVADNCKKFIRCKYAAKN